MRQLKAFVSVFQLRKFSAAAEQLHITQSAVSLLIRELEQGLGVRLFERSTRSLRPTEAAHEALALAERILRDVNSLSSHARDRAGLRRGRVCIAVTPTLAEIFLPETIRNFRLRHPDIQITIDDCAPDQFVERVVSEQVDFGIGSPEQAGADIEEHMLVRDHLVVVAAAGHPLGARTTVRWQELAAHDVITVKPGYGIRPLIDASAAKAGVRLNVVNEVAFLSTALWMAGSGLAVSIMPSAYARHSPIAGLVVRPLTAPRVSRDITWVTKRAKTLSPAAQALVQEIHNTVQAQAARSSSPTPRQRSPAIQSP